MRKTKFFIPFALSALALTACNSGNSITTSTVLSGVVFENQTVTYDGTEHELVATSLPTNVVNVTYSNNKHTDAGTYRAKLTVEYADGTKESFSATQTIERAESVLTAEAVQVGYSLNGATPTYSLNNTEQTIDVKTYYYAGQYTIDLYAQKSTNYNESNHVTVTLTVNEGNSLGVTFDDLECDYDGQAHSLSVQGLPAGYTVEYSDNNTKTDVGTYKVSAVIKDASGKAVDTVYATLKINATENASFTSLVKEFLKEDIYVDFFTVNQFYEDCTSYGISYSDFDAYEFRKYTGFSDAEAYAADLAESKKLKEQVEAFDDSTLSKSQQLEKNSLLRLYEYYVNLLSIDGINDFIGLSYIDSYGGSVSDAISSFEHVTLRSEEDVTIVLAYLESTYSCFTTYDEYVSDAAVQGYPFSDTTLGEMEDFLKEIIDTKDKYYLVDILEGKINGCEFLDDAKKSTYITTLNYNFENYFFKGVEELYDSLDDYMGNCETEGYLQTYGETGQEYYRAMVEYKTGVKDINMDAYFAECTQVMKIYGKKLNDALATYQKLGPVSRDACYAYINGDASLVGITDINEMLSYLVNVYAPTIVTDLDNAPEIDVEYIDDTLADYTNAMAYYILSPFDNTQNERVYLNPNQFSETNANYNEKLMTLAHEGYPGHLYGHVRQRELGATELNIYYGNITITEGWAKYVEYKLLEYIAKNTTDPSKLIAIEYLKANQVVGYMIENVLDIGINYYGWTVDRCASYLDSQGFNGQAAQSAYDMLIENPVTYASYAYGLVKMIEMHDYAQTNLGELYNEQDFNEKVVFTAGYRGISTFESLTKSYVESVLYKYGK